MLEIKQFGNNIAHIRPSIQRKEWDDLVISMLDDPTDIKDVQMAKDILKLLEIYNPVPLTGDWILKKP